jgi:hypothetical protein
MASAIVGHLVFCDHESMPASWFSAEHLPRWLRPAPDPRAQRLARAEALVQDLPPVSCTTEEQQQHRRDWEKRMASWEAADWEAYDAPWADLLSEWLAGPEDLEGLKALSAAHQQAWWPARFAPHRPAETPVTRVVWTRLRTGQALPDSVLGMAAMSAKPFQADYWHWALQQPTFESVDQGVSVFRHSLQAFAMLKAWPTATPAAFDHLWDKVSSTQDQSRLLVSWLMASTDQADPWLERLAARPARLTHDGGGRLMADAWHEGFFATVKDHLIDSTHTFPLERWGRHRTTWNMDLLKRGLQRIWAEMSQDLGEAVATTRLDTITQVIEPVVPLTFWADPNCWSGDVWHQMHRTRQRMQAQERQREALPEIPAGRRRRPRS